MEQALKPFRIDFLPDRSPTARSQYLDVVANVFEAGMQLPRFLASGGPN